jgi:hypothetical protein
MPSQPDNTELLSSASCNNCSWPFSSHICPSPDTIRLDTIQQPHDEEGATPLLGGKVNVLIFALPLVNLDCRHLGLSLGTNLLRLSLLDLMER